ncbi:MULTISPECIES: ROK family protein [Virgibacillus]|uniref:ROK family protein n=1 Tax=Virgibacillus salarius TaxID=447199 RepID=A0A941I8U7_9BACI|nr:MULTISPECIES: ROK family protein [Virgibacillus]MBR7796024.1 ROK family protein [Virgibacillus salarius]NAZ08735.1 ROK family protein [Agaribacter marinus]
MRYAIGIDIGGTTVEAGIVNEKGDLIQKESVQSDPSNKEKMFLQVIQCVNQLLNHSSIPEDEIYGIGAGIPGKIDRRNGVAVFQNNLPWSNFPIVHRLREALGIDNIVIDNDVYMAAFAEWKEAKMLEDELFVYITISTGISCSIIQGGNFIRGAGFAGELGLIPVFTHTADHSMERLEHAASGPAMQAKARSIYVNEALVTKDIFIHFTRGESNASRLVDEMIHALTQGVYMINSILDPHKIVFGGSVATYNPYILPLLKDKLKNYLIEEQLHILQNMEISNLNNGQGIIGAGLRAFR